MLPICGNKESCFVKDQYCPICTHLQQIWSLYFDDIESVCCLKNTPVAVYRTLEEYKELKTMQIELTGNIVTLIMHRMGYAV
jgi:hypothetical protein